MVLVVTPAWDSTQWLTAAVRARCADAEPGDRSGTWSRSSSDGRGWRGTTGSVRAAPGEPVKREGDGRSPAGAFALDTAFGFDSRDVTPGCVCPTCGCARRRSASTMRDPRTTTRSWTATACSAWTGRAPRRCGRSISTRTACTWRTTRRRRRCAGSCIFLHVWAGPRSVTAGCTAMDVDALKELIGVDRSAAAADARAASAERTGAARERVALP